MSIRKNDWTKEDLVRNGVSVEWENNQPIIKQTYQKQVRDRSKEWSEIRPVRDLIGRHKYGKDRAYPVVDLKMDGKYRTVLVSNIAWVWEHGAIGDFDIDHIDGNPMNNSLENLRRLTHEENLRYRKEKNNQWTINKS